MFANFTFDSPRSPSLGSENSTLTRDTSRSVSPCSEQSPFPRPSFTVTDLAAQFSNQRLRKDSQICYDACDSYANDDDEAGWQLPPLTEENDATQLTRSRTTQRAHSPSRRLARQISTRLLCSGAQQKDISALVARMVDQDQCNIIPSPTSLTSQEDEGYDSAEESTHSRRNSVAVSKPKLSYRRASDLKTTGGCISKNVRQRKDRAHLRHRTDEKR